MNTDTYYIPVNFTNAGRILGLFEIRNLIDTSFNACRCCMCA